MIQGTDVLHGYSMYHCKYHCIFDAHLQYAPEIAALEKELSDLDQRPGKAYDECMYVDSILSSQQCLLERELAMCK